MTANTSKLTMTEKRELAKKLLNMALTKENLSKKSTRNQIDYVNISESCYNFKHFPEYKKFMKEYTSLDTLNIRNPYFVCHEDNSSDTIHIQGKEYINYSGYNYLGFSGSRDVNEATKDAIDQYGTSVSASRIVSGEITLHRELEKEIADLIGTESSVVFVSGYGTNLSTIGYLMRINDIVFYDEHSHNSLIAGCKQAGARRISFRHNDWKDLNRIMSKNRKFYERALVVIEGVYSMDGDIANLPEIIKVKKKHKALLMVDEAHSIGTIGKTGRGIREYFDIDPNEVDIWMGTLSKSLASCGGYIAGSKALIDLLKRGAPGGIMYSAGISPPNAAAALAAVIKIKKEPEHAAKLRENYGYFLSLAKEKCLNTGLSKGTPVIPIIIKDSILCLKLADRLFNKGINVHPILYPAVAENDARLRFFVTSKHTKEQIKYTVEAISETLNNFLYRNFNRNSTTVAVQKVQ